MADTYKQQLEEENVLLLWDRMGDYHRARWWHLQKSLKERRVFAVDLGIGDHLYQWDNTAAAEHYVQLTKEAVDKVSPLLAFNRFVKLIRLNNIRYVCIPGYGRIAYLLMLMAARMHGCKVIMFAESWYPGRKAFDVSKGQLLNLLVDVFFVSGSRAEAHFNKRLGISGSKILKGYSVVDNLHFSNTVVRKIDTKVLVCIARYAQEKNLINLIKVFLVSELYQKGWILRLVGDGPLKQNLIELVSKEDTHQQVFLEGWKSYSELPAVYAQASCFILPSLFEPWGLVINEAMSAGLPVIVSEQTGARPDLINSFNGWSFDATNNESLKNVLNELGEKSSHELMKMGRQSALIIENFGLNTWSSQIIKGFSLTPSQDNH